MLIKYINNSQDNKQCNNNCESCKDKIETGCYWAVGIFTFKCGKNIREDEIIINMTEDG